MGLLLKIFILYLSELCIILNPILINIIVKAQ